MRDTDSPLCHATPGLPALDAVLGRMLHAAWIAPALCIALGDVRAMLFAAEGTAPGVALSAIAWGLWIGCSFLPDWRSTLLEIGRVLVGRIGFVPWLLLTLLLLVLVARQGSLGAGVTISAALLCGAALRQALRGDRKALAFSLVIVALNLLLLVILNLFVDAFVLPKRSHNNLFTEHDSRLGWKLRRGLTAQRRTDEFTATESIDLHGFRTAEIPFEKPAGTQRIVFLGDSHTEAYTVNDAETYTALIAARLAAERPLQVVSLGVGGYSTDQELLAYLHHGRRYAPDLVVLQFCTNDVPYNVLGEYWRGRKPVFERYGAVLMLTGVPVPNLRDTGLFGAGLLRRAPLSLFLEAALRQLAIKRDVEEKVDPEEAWRVTELLLRDLNRIVASDGARLVVFLVDRDPDAEARLRRALAAYEIPFLETAGAYTEDFDSYWVAGHWNQKGQRAIAEVLVPALRALLGTDGMPLP
ncbi:MAG: SGNH/GDSL hydrolase family protein [Myxococcales bacterium]|nr:SGNH/GDSL hydrolase family protein [Myxococcales bacterium]MDH5307091.1 SGNH/GDSL hydrolase family protein [Myxococcales bacterium]MDH5565064.1 SGNH/GDSL hydrolase family protein [Myxococcales bacterium]